MINKHSIPELDAKGLRQFAFTFSVILCVLFGGILPFIMKHAFPVWPWVVGLIFIIWGSLIPLTLRPVYKAWVKFGLIMGKITTPIILGILLYGVLTPVGFIMRLFNLDPLKRALDKKLITYRKLRDDSIKTNFEKPY